MVRAPPTTHHPPQGLRGPFERARASHGAPAARRRSRRRRETLERRRRRSRAALLPGATVPALRSSVAEAAALRFSRCATPPSPSAGARSTRCTEPLEQRAAHDVFDIPTPPQETTCAVTWRAHVGARARSAPAFGAERVARGSDPAATGARVRSAHAIGAERVTRGDAGSHTDTRCPTCPTRTSTCTTGRLLPSSATLSKKGH